MLLTYKTSEHSPRHTGFIAAYEGKELEKKKKFFQIFFSNYYYFLFFFQFLNENFWHQICIHKTYLKIIDNPYLVGKIFKNISPDSVWSSRTCPANLGVWSCLVMKFQKSSPVQPYILLCSKTTTGIPRFPRFRFSLFLICRGL